MVWGFWNQTCWRVNHVRNVNGRHCGHRRAESVSSLLTHAAGISSCYLFCRFFMRKWIVYWTLAGTHQNNLFNLPPFTSSRDGHGDIDGLQCVASEEFSSVNITTVTLVSISLLLPPIKQINHPDVVTETVLTLSSVKPSHYISLIKKEQRNIRKKTWRVSCAGAPFSPLVDLLSSFK